MALALLYKITTKSGIALYLAGTCEEDAVEYCKHNKVGYTGVECMGRIANLNLWYDEDGIVDEPTQSILPVSEELH